LRAVLKEEAQFNKRVELNISVKERQDAIKQLEQDLDGNKGKHYE